MSKIYSLRIANFRGIEEFNYVFGKADFICLIGRGDSGKSTLLEAISYALSPSWNLNFFDTDFCDLDIEIPIEIEVTLRDVPEELLGDNKYGLHKRFLKHTGEIIDDALDSTLDDQTEDLLTILLKVEKDLEPKWHVINTRQEAREIRATDRAKLNTYFLADYVDRHFSWSKGSPLYSLLREDKNHNEIENSSVIIEALRKAKDSIDTAPFVFLEPTVKKVIDNAKSFGIDIEKTKTTIDAKDFSIKDGKVCLHDENVPFRLKGKGTKRLLSMAIQIELAKVGGIVLIDEIEQGLEPDRAKHLVRTLKKSNAGQVIFTTHSRDVIVELDANNLFKLEAYAETIFAFDSQMQKTLRKNPEAFFAKKIILCEGKTEIGVCMALDEYRIQKGEASASFHGVSLAYCEGSNLDAHSREFKKADYELCIFCDTDDQAFNEKKRALEELGIEIIDLEIGKSIEVQVFSDLPLIAIKDLVAFIKEENQQSFTESTKDFPTGWDNDYSVEHRRLLAALVNKKKWLKGVSQGRRLGQICLKYLDEIKDKKLGQNLIRISDWIKHD